VFDEQLYVGHVCMAMFLTIFSMKTKSNKKKEIPMDTDTMRNHISAREKKPRGTPQKFLLLPGPGEKQKFMLENKSAEKTVR
jgi:hypothetical protein